MTENHLCTLFTGSSGQQFSSWGPQATDWAGQQQTYQHPGSQQQYSPYAAAQPTNGQFTGQGYDAQGGAGMYGAGYDYNSMGYCQGYVGQQSDPAGGQFMGGSQSYGVSDVSSQQFGYMETQQSWGGRGGEQQWGWDQNSQTNGLVSGKDAGNAPLRGRIGSGGDSPAFGSGQGGRLSAFGNGRREGPPAFGSGRGGGLPALGSGRGGPPASGSGHVGGPPASGSGRGGGPPAFGSGRGFGDRGRGGAGGGRGRGFGADRGRGVGGVRAKAFGGDVSGGYEEDENLGYGVNRDKSFVGDRGRGRGDGGPGRGRGGNSFGSNRGRGASGRGSSSFGDRGRGGINNTRGRGGHLAFKESVTVADTGVGLSSIGDLIKSAQQRRLQDATKGLSPDAPLSAFVGRWKSFSRDFVDCGNPISNLECSLKASKVNTILQQ